MLIFLDTLLLVSNYLAPGKLLSFYSSSLFSKFFSAKLILNFIPSRDKLFEIINFFTKTLNLKSYMHKYLEFPPPYYDNFWYLITNYISSIFWISQTSKMFFVLILLSSKHFVTISSSLDISININCWY